MLSNALVFEQYFCYASSLYRAVCRCMHAGTHITMIFSGWGIFLIFGANQGRHKLLLPIPPLGLQR